ERGEAGRHRDRVRVEGAALADARSALPRIVVRHDVAPAAERADGQAATDDLAERREVGPNAEALLRAAPRHAERDHLVEDQHDAAALRLLAQPRQEALGGRDQPGVAEDRVDDERGDLLAVLREDLRARLLVVPREHDDVLEYGGWDAGRPRDRLGALAVAGGLRVRRYAHHHPVVGAMKGALELRDLRPAGEGARQSHRV